MFLHIRDVFSPGDCAATTHVPRRDAHVWKLVNSLADFVPECPKQFLHDGLLNDERYGTYSNRQTKWGIHRLIITIIDINTRLILYTIYNPSAPYSSGISMIDHLLEHRNSRQRHESAEVRLRLVLAGGVDGGFQSVWDAQMYRPSWKKLRTSRLNLMCRWCSYFCAVQFFLFFLDCLGWQNDQEVAEQQVYLSGAAKNGRW